MASSKPVCLCLLAALWGWPGADASAQPHGEGGVVLIWQAPEGCPSQNQVRLQVEQLLGQPLSQVRQPAMRSEARVSGPEQGRWRLQLQTHTDGQLGERSLEAESCESLASALVLITALAIDPQAGAAAGSVQATGTVVGKATAGGPDRDRVSETSPDADVKTATQPVEEPTGESSDPEQSRESSGARPVPVQMLVRAALLLDAGSLPNVAAGISAGLGLSLGRLELWLGARVLPPSGLGVGPSDTDAGSIAMAAGSADACLGLLGPSLQLAPCAGLELGQSWGHGSAAVGAGTGGDLWLALQFSARLTYLPLPWLGLDAQAGVGLPLLRPVFTLQGLAEVHSASALVGRLELGAHLAF